MSWLADGVGNFWRRLADRPLTNMRVQPKGDMGSSSCDSTLSSDPNSSFSGFTTPHIPQYNVSKYLRMGELAHDFGNNDDFVSKVNCLTRDGYIGWRRIRGDGNCFYRSVGYGLLEQIVEASLDLRMKWALHLLQELQALDSEVLDQPGYADLCSHVKRISEGGRWQARPSLTSPVDSSGDIWQSVKDPAKPEVCLNNSYACQMDLALIACIRRLTAKYLIEHAEDIEEGDDEPWKYFVEALGFKTMEEYCKKEVSPMGIDAANVTMKATARCLNIGVRIAFMDRFANDKVPYEEYKVCSDSARDGDRRPCIHLQLRPGHYDLMYHQAKPRQVDSIGSCSSDHHAPLTPPFSPAALTAKPALPVLLQQQPDFGRDVPSSCESRPPTLSKSDNSKWTVAVPMLELVDEQKQQLSLNEQDREVLEEDAFGPPPESKARQDAQQQEEDDDRRNAVKELAKKRKAKEQRAERRKQEEREKRKLAEVVKRVEDQATPDSSPLAGTQVAV